MPGYAKMVVNEQIEDYIGRFMREYFKVYDTNNREQVRSQVLTYKK